VPESLAVRKARGAFFTPPDISQFIVGWAVRSADDRVLEPSCGEASFLLAAGERLRRLADGQLFAGGSLHGIEVHAESAEVAGRIASERGLRAEISVSDFLDVEPERSFDAVVGNPPYIRYQDFTGQARAKGLRAALAEGVRLTGLASSWAAFTVHAARFLKPGGRLGLVLPAELLAVNYAAEVRRFLLSRFAKIRLVLFEERVFPGVLEEVVLLLAEGIGPAPSFEVFQASGIRDLANLESGRWSWFTPDKDGKWTPALIPDAALDTYNRVTTQSVFSPLLDWGETYLGSVTGNNAFFCLTHAQVRALRLRSAELRPLSPPGSRHLGGMRLTTAAWRSLVEAEHRCYLFAPRRAGLSPGAAEYVRSGERMGVNQAYKCRVRIPWWRVPVVTKPDLMLTYMAHDRPRLVSNDARVDILNSVYGVTLRQGRKELGKELLPIAMLNSLSLLGAEMVGRAYGGGLLKLEPKEADRLPVPSKQLLEATAGPLRALRPQLSTALRSGRLTDAIKLVDRTILQEGAGLEWGQLRAIRRAREALFARRVSRAKS